MKAKSVRGLDRAGPIADNAERIVRVRAKELRSFGPRATQSENVKALHDLRIAAKRLRYLLEVTGFCFGPFAATAARRARELQDLVGEIHDCDVMGPRVQGRIEALRAADTRELVRLAEGNGDLSPALSARAPSRTAYRGLEVLAAHIHARRELLFQQFLEQWETLERDKFWKQLDEALSERPAKAN
jgi:CHAD domain-containing protein